MDRRNVAYTDLRERLSRSDGRWKILDGLKCTLPTGEECTILVKSTRPNPVFVLDYGSRKSRNLGVRDLDKHLTDLKFDVDLLLSQSSWKWLLNFPLSDEDRAAHSAKMARQEAERKRRDESHKAAVRQMEKRILAKRQEQEELLRTEKRRQEALKREEIAKLESWFGTSIPGSDNFEDRAIDLLGDWIERGERPKTSSPDGYPDHQYHIADAVWWLNEYNITNNPYPLASSSAAWRRARLPNIAIEVTSSEIDRNQDRRNSIERVLTSHAAALCDLWQRDRSDNKKLERAIALDRRAIAQSPNDSHPYMQLHRAHGLLGQVSEAVDAMAKAIERTRDRSKLQHQLSNEIKWVWARIKTEDWGQEYSSAVRNAMGVGAIPDMLDIPF